MSQHKYRYNPEKLKYEKVQPGFVSRFFTSGIAHFSMGILVAGAAFFFTIDHFGPMSKVRELKREKELLAKQYDNMNKDLESMEQSLQKIQFRDDKIYRSIFETEPISKNIRTGGIGGVDHYEHLKGYDNSELVIKTHKKLNELSHKVKVQDQSFEDLTKLAKERRAYLSAIPAIRPIKADQIDRMASGFGIRLHPIYKTPRMHPGVDFTASIGTKIHATGNGTVENIERKNNGYGRNVTIDHGHGYKTLYAHLNGFEVKEGQKVKRGDVIGKVGNTGTSTGAHLHYEVIKEDKKVDPVNFFFNELSPKEYEQVVQAAAATKSSL